VAAVSDEQVLESTSKTLSASSNRLPAHTKTTTTTTGAANHVASELSSGRSWSSEHAAADVTDLPDRLSATTDTDSANVHKPSDADTLGIGSDESTAWALLAARRKHVAPTATTTAGAAAGADDDDVPA